MFRVNYKGKEYSIYFSYDGTTTNVEMLDDGGGMMESARCRPTDRFDKAVGRKVALTRLLSRVGPVELRRLIWEKYWSMTKFLSRKQNQIIGGVQQQRTPRFYLGNGKFQTTSHAQRELIK